MFFKPLCFFGLLVSVFGDGEIVFLQAPSSITFQGKEQLPLSLVKDVFSSALGFSLQENHSWRGIQITDPFNYAEGVVVVSVPGLPSLGTSQGHKFAVETDSPLEDIWSALEWRVTERFPYSDNESLVHIDLSEGKLTSEIQLGSLTEEPTKLSVLKHLNPEIEDDKLFLDQVALLNAISRKVEEDGVMNDGVPDIYWFVVTGVHPLIDKHGLKSKPVFEAKQLLEASLERLSEAYTRAYDSKVLIAAVASDAPHTRRYRRDAGIADTKEMLKYADGYTDNYPVIFNIILWFGIAYAFVLLAVALGISDMDPGRDSIIYRMTSNRMKKDN